MFSFLEYARRVFLQTLFLDSASFGEEPLSAISCLQMAFQKTLYLLEEILGLGKPRLNFISA